jgi:hypothetical protein
MVFGLLAILYIYVMILKLIPSFLRGFSQIIFVSIVYSYFIHNIFFEFSEIDLWDQNKIILFTFFVVMTSYLFKNRIRNIMTDFFIQTTFEIVSVVTMHLSLYDKNMTDLSTLIYSFSFTFIFWKICHRYLKNSIELNGISLPIQPTSFKARMEQIKQN